MEVKLINEQENKLFNRKEIRFEVVHEGETTPDLMKVRNELGKKTGSDAGHIIIDGFKTLFGIGRTMGNARIYKDIDEMKDYEPTYLLKRNKIIQEKKEGEEAEIPVEKVAEAPVEVPKEAPKEEAEPAGPTEEEIVEQEIRAEEDKKTKRLKDEREKRESEE